MILARALGGQCNLSSALSGRGANPERQKVSPVWQGSKPREANAADAHPDDPYLAGAPVPHPTPQPCPSPEGSLG